MNKEYMPAGGVKELVKTAEGRRYLAKLQKKYEMDIIQPNDPRFKKIYGDKFKRHQETREQQERMAKSEWEESRARNTFKKTKIIFT